LNEHNNFISTKRVSWFGLCLLLGVRWFAIRVRLELMIHTERQSAAAAMTGSKTANRPKATDVIKCVVS